MTKAMLEAKLKQSEQELTTKTQECDQLQGAINAKVRTIKTLKLHIDGTVEIEQNIGPGDVVTFADREDGKGFQYEYIAK